MKTAGCPTGAASSDQGNVAVGVDVVKIGELVDYTSFLVASLDVARVAFSGG